MAKILVPVDFSVPCHNAYRYALHLAKEMNYDVVLTHYYSGSVNPKEPFVIRGDGSIQGSYETRLRQFAYPSGEGVDYPLVEPPSEVNISYETRVVLSTAAAIVNRADEPDIALIVMATRSTPGMLDKWLGSTSITVSESCNQPVFLIPPHVSYQKVDRIVVANNHDTADPISLWQIGDLAGLFSAHVHFVHVENPGESSPFRFVPWKLMEELVEAQEVNYPFEIVTVRDKDITAGLLEFADDVDADLVVIVNRRRKRWHAALRATLSQNIALRTKLPLLVLHTEATETEAA